MTARARDHYDVTVIGAGPAGTVAAIAQAQKGARVLLVEANPNGVRRLAGEWLHPPALEVVRELGIDLAHLTGRYETGEGFVLFPDDASDPVRLPYADGARGFSCEHAELVSALREAARAHDGIDYLPFARVTEIRDGRCTIARADGPLAVSADLVVGADGRNSVLRRTLGLAARALPVSRMVGLRLNGVEMPFEGFGHVFLGGSGPLLVYRIGPDTLRLIADIPLNGYGAGDRTAHLWEEFGPVLPAPLRAAFREALSENAYDIAVNAVSPRASYGRGRYALVGDAAGHYHPLTALGMTLGFADGMALAGARNVDAYRRRRQWECRVPEMVAIGIHQSFSRLGDDAVAVRRAIVDLWRTDPDERRRTMRYLACQDRRVVPFVMSFVKVMGRAIARVVGGGAGAARWRHASRVIASMAAQIRSWIGTTLLHRNAARPDPDGSSTAVAWRETPAGSGLARVVLPPLWCGGRHRPVPRRAPPPRSTAVSLR